MAQSALADAHQVLINSQEQHRAILDALAAGASARAESIAREHSNLAKNVYMRPRGVKPRCTRSPAAI